MGGTIWVETIRQCLADIAERDARIAELRADMLSVANAIGMTIDCEGRGSRPAQIGDILARLHNLQGRVDRAESELAKKLWPHSETRKRLEGGR
jgi:hypothetical protein